MPDNGPIANELFPLRPNDKSSSAPRRNARLARIENEFGGPAFWLYDNEPILGHYNTRIQRSSIFSREYGYYTGNSRPVILGKAVVFGQDQVLNSQLYNTTSMPTNTDYTDQAELPSYYKYIVDPQQSIENDYYTDMMFHRDRRSKAVSLKIIVYRIGPGMYHSGISINDLYEWHFFEGSGVRQMPRIEDEESILDGTGRKAALVGLPVVEEVIVDGIHQDEIKIYEYCNELSQSSFSPDSYDLLRNNCNHFTSTLLGLCQKKEVMPKYVNRMANTVKIICSTVPGAEGLIFRILGR